MSPSKFENIQRSATFSLLVWSILVSSCSGFVDWIYPGSENTGLTFNYIDTVYFTWTSNISSPYMNLWCAPNNTSPQSKIQAYTAQVSTNGTSPQSFHYSEYENNGICHMQLEDFAGDNFGNTPTFDITSNDAVQPQTWGLSAISLLGGGSSPTATAPSTTAASSAFIATAPASSSTSLPTSSSSPSSSSASSTTPSPTIPTLATTTRATAPLTSPSSPSETLDTAAKAAISIGSIFGAIVLIITVLLVRTARLRRTRGRMQDLNGFGPSEQHNLEDTAEIGEGTYFEVHGVARPSELHGMPRVALD